MVCHREAEKWGPVCIAVKWWSRLILLSMVSGDGSCIDNNEEWLKGVIFNSRTPSGQVKGCQSMNSTYRDAGSRWKCSQNQAAVNSVNFA